MKKLSILGVLAFLLSAIVSVIGWLTVDRTKYRNDFVRIFPSHVAEPTNLIEMSAKRFSLAGFSSCRVYLRDRSSRNGLIEIGATGDTTYIPIHIPNAMEIAVDSPYFFLYDGYTATIQRGNVTRWSVDTTYGNIPGFTLALPTSPNTVVLRTIHMTQRKNVLTKSSSTGTFADVLRTQIDGIFCTDGYLNFSKEHNRIIYTYRYRNQFISLDTNLNVILTGKTIDTTSVARITVKEIHGKLTMSRPPLIVNRSTSVDGKYLFVNSNLVAKNETASDSEARSVIDVYNVLDGSYKFSFYIDNISNSRMRSFGVKGKTCYAMFPSHIVKYKLLDDYFTE